MKQTASGSSTTSGRRQAASYAGLDTVLKEPGKFKGRTGISKKGNAAVRQCLFMPALSAANHNKNMQAFYARIVERNPQAKRKAIVACMRKLLTLVFVLWKKEEEYDENYLWGKKPARHGRKQTNGRKHRLRIKESGTQRVPHLTDPAVQRTDYGLHLTGTKVWSNL
ncbi:Transposase IS116/IS110/IS902 family protein [Bacteroidales bacterium Barb6XT]|nr:Transposase IS116/IS110/IS902 family protein [Bacteroidales bacterium Barb6XT]